MGVLRTVRYGVKTRKRREAALAQQKATYECPRCGKLAVRRTGYARWACRACGLVFAGGAYAPETAVGAAARKALESVAKA